MLATLVRQLRLDYGLGPEVPTLMGGISNGAMETMQVDCRYPGMLDAAFLDAGGLQDPTCQVARTPRLLMTRGLLDDTVPIKGLKYSGLLNTNLAGLGDAASMALRLALPRHLAVLPRWHLLLQRAL